MEARAKDELQRLAGPRRVSHTSREERVTSFPEVQLRLGSCPERFACVVAFALQMLADGLGTTHLNCPPSMARNLPRMTF